MALFNKKNLRSIIRKNGNSKDFLMFLKDIEEKLNIKLEPTGEVYIKVIKVLGDIFEIIGKDNLYMIIDEEKPNSTYRFCISFFSSDDLTRDIEDGELDFLGLRRGESLFKITIKPSWYTDVILYDECISDLKKAIKNW